MKIINLILIGTSVMLLNACDSQQQERTELSDYKKQQLEKAKQVEQEMNKRMDNLDKQLEQATNKEDDDT